MERAKPVACRKEELSISDVVNHFRRATESVLPSAALKPKAGEIYFITWKDDNSKNDWRVDGYRWFQYGTKLIPRSEPVLKKIHFCLVLPAGHDKRFRRQAFFLLEQPCAVLIHYLGDESISVDFPHGNSRGENNGNFLRTFPSVLGNLSLTRDLPSNVYKDAVSKARVDCPPEIQLAYMPRNLRQIKNIQYKERLKCRLTHDAIYNLHELAYDLDDFVKVITTYPDLIIICGLDKLVKDLDLVLQMDTEGPQLLSYDTTFKLGDFYVSPLLYRQTLFSNRPVIPALFIIHERKFQLVHEKFMQCLAGLVPSLVKLNRSVPLVTDDESGIKNAICKHLPGVIWLRCWNHTINSVKAWLKKHGASSTEVPVYISQLREMLNQSSEATYEEKLQEYKGLWSESFYHYYMDEIHQEMGACLGRWVLEPLRVYHPFSGVTTNQSEGFNTTLKRLQRWREVPVDTIVLTLYQLQSYFYNEIHWGLAGLGNYKLSVEFPKAAISLDDLNLISCPTPEEIVDRLSKRDAAATSETAVKHDFDDEDPYTEKENMDGSDLLVTTPYARAREVIEKKNINHNQSLGVFTVIGSTGNPHAICLFPRESCTCPSTGRCYHILAVRMSVGLEEVNAKNKVNLTQLRRNTRSRAEKKSGRKAPRPGDYCIKAAPDSQISNLLGEPEKNELTDEEEEYKSVMEGEEEQHLQKATSQSMKNDTIQNYLSKTRKLALRRRRCGECDGCTASDCGECRFCRDKPKFGGRGSLKQCCLQRRCTSIQTIPTADHGTKTSSAVSVLPYKSPPAKKEKVKFQKKFVDEVRGGIRNRQNSCWLISDIQLLNATMLHEFFDGMDNANSIQVEYARIRTLLRGKKEVNITVLKKLIGKTKQYLAEPYQHDAVEGLQHLLDTLVQGISECNSEMMFTLSYMSSAFCTACKNNGSNEFQDIAVEKYTVVYCSLETVTDSKCQTVSEIVANTHHLNEVCMGPADRQCEYCMDVGNVEVKHTLVNLPKYLFVAFSRATTTGMDIRSGLPGRCSTPVVIERNMQFTLDTGPTTDYQLEGYLVHHGVTAASGHYTAHILHGRDTLVCYDDFKVSEVGIETIHSQYTQANVTLLYSASQIQLSTLEEQDQKDDKDGESMHEKDDEIRKDKQNTIEGSNIHETSQRSSERSKGRKRSRSAAALRAEKLRFKKRRTTSGSPHIIDLTTMEGPTDTTESTTWKKFGSVQLHKSDREILESDDWLSDNLVNATQVLLREKYGKPGFQNTGLGRTMSFDIVGHTEFIQVLNSVDQHWIAVSTIGCEYSHLNIYDSMYPDVPTSTREQICALLASSQSSIHLDFANVQLQPNCCDCGLFALAFCATLCEGEDPVTKLYDSKVMRMHLLGCLEEGEIRPFPSETKAVFKISKKQDTIAIVCYCRTQARGKMLQCATCSEWYHEETCVKLVTPSAQERIKWNCDTCGCLEKKKTVAECIEVLQGTDARDLLSKVPSILSTVKDIANGKVSGCPSFLEFTKFACGKLRKLQGNSVITAVSTSKLNEITDHLLSTMTKHISKSMRMIPYAMDIVVPEIMGQIVATMFNISREEARSVLYCNYKEGTKKSFAEDGAED